MSAKSLKDFLTTDKDQLRHIPRMPSEMFRMWEIDLVPEKRPSKGQKGEYVVDFEDDTGDFYDNFVIIER